MVYGMINKDFCNLIKVFVGANMGENKVSIRGLEN